MMSIVYFMIGIPSSGKTTWARENLPGCVIVSTDAIREESSKPDSPDDRRGVF